MADTSKIIMFAEEAWSLATVSNDLVMKTQETHLTSISGSLLSHSLVVQRLNGSLIKALQLLRCDGNLDITWVLLPQHLQPVTHAGSEATWVAHAGSSEATWVAHAGSEAILHMG